MLGAPCLVLFEFLPVLLLAVCVLMVLRFMLGFPLGVLDPCCLLWYCVFNWFEFCSLMVVVSL